MRLFKKKFSSTIRPVSNRIAGFRALLGEVKLQKKERISHPDIINEMMVSRSYLLAIWGIEDSPEEIKKVMDGLKLESVLFALLAIIPLVSLLTDASSLVYWEAIAMVSPVCLYIASTKIWRRDCIKAGRLIPYFKWWGLA